MAQVGIDSFDGVGLLFVGSHFIGSAIVECVIDRKGIGVILFGLRCAFQASLQGFGGTLLDHIPTQHTARVPIHDG